MLRPTQKIYCLVVLFLMSILLTACSKTDREKEALELIQRAATLAEAQDLGGLMGLTQDGFVADPGKHTSDEARRLLFVTFKRFGIFHIYYSKPAIRLSEDESVAQVKLNFIMATKGRLFPELEQLYQKPAQWIQAVDERADIYSLSMELRFVSGEWLVSTAKVTGFAWPGGRL